MWGWIPQQGQIIAGVFGGMGLGATLVSVVVAHQLSKRAVQDANARMSSAETLSRVEIAKSRADADEKIAIARAETAEAFKQAEFARLEAARLIVELAKFREPRLAVPEEVETDREGLRVIASVDRRPQRK